MTNYSETGGLDVVRLYTRMSDSDSALSRSKPPPICPTCRDFTEYDTQISLEDAGSKAKSGCEPCAIIVSAARIAVQQEVQSPAPWRTDVPTEDDLVKVTQDSNGFIIINAHRSRHSWHKIFTTSESWQFRGLELRIAMLIYQNQIITCVGESSPWEEVKCMQIRPPQSVDLISKWVEGCVENHPRCRQQPSPLPTRIIDVGCLPEDIPKLFSGQGRIEPY